MLVAGLQYLLSCILPQNITKEFMFNVRHVLLFVWEEEWIRLLDDVLSIIAAWLDFDTVEYDLSTAVLVMVMMLQVRYLRKILNHQHTYNKTAQSRDPEISCESLNPGIPGLQKSSRIISPIPYLHINNMYHPSIPRYHPSIIGYIPISFPSYPKHPQAACLPPPLPEREGREALCRPPLTFSQRQ